VKISPQTPIFYQNIFMGAELERRFLGMKLLDKQRMIRQAKIYLQQINSSLTNMHSVIQNLSGGQRQSVAIARALRWEADIIIRDEPTAALGVRETTNVLKLIERLKNQGITVILISHNMVDVVVVADQVTILRAGHVRLTRPIGSLNAQELTQLIIQDESS